MQTPDNPDYYLKHGFDKAYSNYGVPYIDEGCAPGLSNRQNGPEKRQDRSADLQSGYQDGGGHGKSHEGGSADLRQGGPHHGTGRKNGSPNPCRCCKSSCESHRVRRQGHCRSG